jgi:hypothetical protein
MSRPQADFFQASNNMAKRPKSKKAKSNVPENYKRWYDDIFNFLEHEKDGLPGGRSDLEVRYLETCQLAIVACEQLGIAIPEKLK